DHSCNVPVQVGAGQGFTSRIPVAPTPSRVLDCRSNGWVVRVAKSVVGSWKGAEGGGDIFFSRRVKGAAPRWALLGKWGETAPPASPAEAGQASAPRFGTERTVRCFVSSELLTTKLRVP